MSTKEKLFIVIPLILWLLWGFNFFIVVTNGPEAVMGLMVMFLPLLAGTAISVLIGFRRAILMKEKLWIILGVIVILIILYTVYAIFFQKPEIIYLPVNDTWGL